jgi:hypothetical protein
MDETNAIVKFQLSLKEGSTFLLASFELRHWFNKKVIDELLNAISKKSNI